FGEFLRQQIDVRALRPRRGGDLLRRSEVSLVQRGDIVLGHFVGTVVVLVDAADDEEADEDEDGDEGHRTECDEERKLALLLLRSCIGAGSGGLRAGDARSRGRLRNRLGLSGARAGAPLVRTRSGLVLPRRVRPGLALSTRIRGAALAGRILILTALILVGLIRGTRVRARRWAGPRPIRLIRAGGSAVLGRRIGVLRCLVLLRSGRGHGGPFRCPGGRLRCPGTGVARPLVGGAQLGRLVIGHSRTLGGLLTGRRVLVEIGSGHRLRLLGGVRGCRTLDALGLRILRTRRRSAGLRRLAGRWREIGVIVPVAHRWIHPLRVQACPGAIVLPRTRNRAVNTEKRARSQRKWK